MRVPASAQHQKNTDLLGWQAEERFEVRRAAERRRGAAFRERSGRSVPTPRRPSASQQHLPPTPWLLATVVGSLGALFALAVVGAYALLRALLGSD